MIAENSWILKYTLLVNDELQGVQMHPEDEIVHVGQQGDPSTIQIWIHTPSDARGDELVLRYFKVKGTAHHIGTYAQHRGTVLSANGLVWHVVEMTKARGPVDRMASYV